METFNIRVAVLETSSNKIIKGCLPYSIIRHFRLHGVVEKQDSLRCSSGTNDDPSFVYWQFSNSYEMILGTVLHLNEFSSRDDLRVYLHAYHRPSR